MPFIFKGGTCLMMLMDKPRRLSTDIDIIVEPGTDLDDYLEKASAILFFPTLFCSKVTTSISVATAPSPSTANCWKWGHTAVPGTVAASASATRAVRPLR